MKIWLTLALLLSTTLLSIAQTAPLRMPKEATWVEEYSHQGGRGEKELTCQVNSIEGTSWRSEVTDAEADISISVCLNGKVNSTLNSAPAASPGPVKTVQEVYAAIAGPARFEIIDVIGGVGYSRYRETAPGYTRLIWMDRSTGFPRRISTAFSDGGKREQYFRLIEVDPSTRRRLFDINTLHPFFASYLDEWFARAVK